ncbi:MAG: hypothetical protein AB2809_18345 [Candidatus Thiodiazotropha sp.]
MTAHELLSKTNFLIVTVLIIVSSGCVTTSPHRGQTVEAPPVDSFMNPSAFKSYLLSRLIQNKEEIERSLGEEIPLTINLIAEHIPPSEKDTEGVRLTLSVQLLANPADSPVTPMAEAALLLCALESFSLAAQAVRAFEWRINGMRIAAPGNDVAGTSTDAQGLYKKMRSQPEYQLISHRYSGQPSYSTPDFTDIQMSIGYRIDVHAPPLRRVRF